MVFLANMLSKMKKASPLGSRIAEVHNGSSLFTGDAGSGESNVRRWIIENDWLEAIIALPLNIFYNTGIATYIWVLSNRKAESRKGKVQLIDATPGSSRCVRTSGKKTANLGADDIGRICDAFLQHKEDEASKSSRTMPSATGRSRWNGPELRSQFTRASVETLRFASGDESLRRKIHAEYGPAVYEDFRSIVPLIEAWLKGDEPDDDGNGRKKPLVPEKRLKKLLDPGTWARDKKLLDAARALWVELETGSLKTIMSSCCI